MSLSLLEDCSFGSLTEHIDKIYLNSFDCGNADLNDFEFLFSSEKQESDYMGRDLSDKLKTRMMYFDLLSLKPE